LCVCTRTAKPSFKQKASFERLGYSRTHISDECALQAAALALRRVAHRWISCMHVYGKIPSGPRRNF